MSPTERGNEVCTHLKAQGCNPAWMEATDERVAIGFELISKHPSWTKAVSVDAATLSPETVHIVLNEWKRKVKKEIHIGLPSAIVQHMIAAHGLPTVWNALKEHHA